MNGPGTSDPGGGTRTPSGGRPAGADVGATLREMWSTRPARRRDDRKVAGVAAAVARRYAIDPTLVRVAFVVAAFYGVGILVYVAGWLALPRAERPDEREHSGRVVLAAVLVALVTAGPLAGGRPAGLVGVLVVLALLYALHRSRAALGTRDDPGAPAVPAAASDDAEPSDASAESRPPSWDPLGAAPFAWDLPEPGAAPAARPPRSPLVPATLGLATLAAAAVLVLGLVGLLPLGVTPVVATALAVVGAGLVVGAFRHRGRGLIVAAVPLALVLTAAAGASGPPPWRDGPGAGFSSGFDNRFGDRFGDRPGFGRGESGTSRGIGDGSWSATSAAQVAPQYQTGLGDAQLDLGGLPVGPPVTTTVRSGAGDVSVTVPATADVTVDCHSGAGDVDCLGRGEGQVVDLGPDGPGGPVINLHAESGVGDVEVRRG